MSATAWEDFRKRRRSIDSQPIYLNFFHVKLSTPASSHKVVTPPKQYVTVCNHIDGLIIRPGAIKVTHGGVSSSGKFK